MRFWLFFFYSDLTLHEWFWVDQYHNTSPSGYRQSICEVLETRELTIQYNIRVINLTHFLHFNSSGDQGSLNKWYIDQLRLIPINKTIFFPKQRSRAVIIDWKSDMWWNACNIGFKIVYHFTLYHSLSLPIPCWTQ